MQNHHGLLTALFRWLPLARFNCCLMVLFLVGVLTVQSLSTQGKITEHKKETQTTNYEQIGQTRGFSGRGAGKWVGGGGMSHTSFDFPMKS
jgi:hypothetical protein